MIANPVYAGALQNVKELFIDCGQFDEYNLQVGARLVSQQLRKMGVPYTHEEYAGEILKGLKEAGFRAEIKMPDETLGARIRNAQNEKVPYMIVVGDKEIQAKKIAVRSRTLGDQGQVGLSDFIQKAKEEVSTHK